jgi:hypothetical protein
MNNFEAKMVKISFANARGLFALFGGLYLF